MSDHEQLADQQEREADALEDESARLESQIDEAKRTVKRAEDDAFIATPTEDDPDDGGPEADYPTKD